MSLMGVISALSLVPQAVEVGKSIIGLVSGATPSVSGAVLTATSGLAGTAARAAQAGAAGSSVGPVAGAQSLTGTALQVVAPIAATAAKGALQAVLQPTQLPVITGGGGGGVRTVTRKQMILMAARAANPGATAKKIIRSARQCGIELAAATFGLSVLDVCFLIAQPATRRSRGISAADIRTVSRTARKFGTLQHNLSHLCGPARRTHRRKK